MWLQQEAIHEIKQRWKDSKLSSPAQPNIRQKLWFLHNPLYQMTIEWAPILPLHDRVNKDIGITFLY